MATNEEKMTFAQRKHLLERIERWSNDNYWEKHLKSEKEPAAVVKAQAKINELQKIVSAWRKRGETMRDEARAKVKLAKQSAREAVLFGDPIKALAAVKKLEAMKLK